MYTHEGVEYVRRFGTRQEVWDEVCFQTAGKLIKDDLDQKGSRIISKKRSELGKKRFSEKNPFKKQAVQDEKVSEPLPAVSDTPVAEPDRLLRKKKKKKKKKRQRV